MVYELYRLLFFSLLCGNCDSARILMFLTHKTILFQFRGTLFGHMFLLLMIDVTSHKA